MLYNEYEKILTKGKKTDWYGTEVPEDLLTNQVKIAAQQIQEQVNKYEGVDSNRKKEYICMLLENIKNLPYKLNGDFYLIKKKEIEEKIKKEKKVKPIVQETSKKVTKNSNLIFGNKTK